MIIHIAGEIYAEGEPGELGMFLATYFSYGSTLANIVRKQQAERELMEKLAENFKSVQIKEIPKEGDPDADQQDSPE